MTHRAIPVDAEELARLRESNAALLVALSKVYQRSQAISGDTLDDLKRDLRHIEATCRAAIDRATPAILKEQAA